MAGKFKVGDVIAEEFDDDLIEKVVVHAVNEQTGHCHVARWDGRISEWVVYSDPDSFEYSRQWPALPCNIIPCTYCGGEYDLLIQERDMIMGLINPPVNILEDDD